MSDAVSERDMEAVRRAVGILQAAGFRVRRVSDGEPTHRGVAVDLTLNAPTSVPAFDSKSKAVAEAAKEVPEVDMNGELMTEDEGVEADG